ncbi:proteasome activator complex subunit 3-like [Bacillus rossius redtenbacheri]|uniref:proteasome activator complex subunit 3-like n=1 Tax=Bacillus rossius redtenbacheri TaxID=93214 RepID=UPI002FDDE8FE
MDDELKNYKKIVEREAEELILKKIPKAITKLNDILDTPQFNITNLNDVHQSLNIPIPTATILSNSQDHSDQPDPKKRKYGDILDQVSGTKIVSPSSGGVPCNKYITNMMDLVKPHIFQLIKDANLLQMWICLKIPKIEDDRDLSPGHVEGEYSDKHWVEDARFRLNNIVLCVLPKAQTLQMDSL